MNLQEDDTHTTTEIMEGVFQIFDETDHPEDKYTLEIYRDEEALEQLTEEWEDLAVRADATVYQTPEWIKKWWKFFGKNPKRSLYIITVWQEDILVAFAPFYTGYSVLLGRKIERRLQLVGSGGSPNEQFGYAEDYGISDFLDVITDPGHSVPVARLLADQIITAASEYDTISFHQLRDDSFVIQHMYPLLKNSSLFIKLDHTDTCPYITLDGISNIKEYIKQAKSNARRRFRQTLRATGPDAEFVVEEITEQNEIEKETEVLIQMHQERWNELGYPGVFHDKRFEDFFKEILHGAAQKKRLWFKKTVDAEGVSALRMMIMFNGRYYDYISGFSTTSPSARYRPGFGLLLNSVEEAISSGITRIELLRGEEGYKFDFTDKTIQNYCLSIRRNKGRTVVQNAMHSLAILYVSFIKEKRLVNVNTQQSGLIKGLIGYVKFRFNTIKSKLS